VTTDQELLDDLGEAVPARFTKPTPDAPHDLPAVELIAKALGTPLMPWQRLVARVATERRLDDPRRFRYSPIVLTVPRQSGKTTLMRGVLTQRAMTNARRRAFYTAQTGKDATARWKDLVEQIAAGPLRKKVILRKAIGSQSLTFPTLSTISPFAPTAESLHGYTPHDVMCDEIFAFDDAQGNDLMGAIGPAQVTLLLRQLWLVSTRGTPASTFLNYWLEQGDASVDDPEAGLAFFDWHMPAGLDPYDPTSWAFHPALGHTITLDDLAQLAKQHTYGEWMRAFMNTQTVVLEALIDPARIRDLQTRQTPPADRSDLALSYEVAADRSRSAIMAAWFDPATGQPAIKIVESHAGDSWLPAAIDELRTDLHPRAIGADDGGPTRDITDQLRSRYYWAADELEIITARDFATACDALKARVLDSTISLDAAGELTESFDNVVTRTMGQGYAWDRVKSRGPIPELVAGTVALRLLEHAPAPMPSPIVRFS
jgi:hypothetical protein